MRHRRRQRHVRRHDAGQVPLDDGPQRGRRRATRSPAASCRSRRPAATSPAAREREEHRAPAGPDQRQLVGDDQGVDRRHRRLPAGRPRRLQRAAPPGASSWSCAARVASGRPSWAATAATRTAPPCPPTPRRRSRCRCTCVTASSAAATRSTTARPGPRSATASTPAALGAPSIGLAAYNGTGAETGTFEAFTVGAPPELPASPPCATPYTPGGRLHGAVRRHRRVAGRLAVRRRRSLRPRGLHDQVRRRVRPDVHQEGLQGARTRSSSSG